MKLILASGSPRRKELLTQVGLSFEIKVSDVEEVTTATEPAQVVKDLSSQKAKAVWETLTEKDRCDAVVLGADTVVSLDGKILGKPKTEQEACEMLQALSGQTHQVYTGVSLVTASQDKEPEVIRFAECTDVTFYEMSVEEIEAYVATGDPMDKAGAYGIQGAFAAYVKGIQGDYNNVVGLPVARVYHELKNLKK